MTLWYKCYWVIYSGSSFTAPWAKKTQPIFQLLPGGWEANMVQLARQLSRNITTLVAVTLPYETLTQCLPDSTYNMQHPAHSFRLYTSSIKAFYTEWQATSPASIAISRLFSRRYRLCYFVQYSNEFSTPFVWHLRLRANDLIKSTQIRHYSY